MASITLPAGSIAVAHINAAGVADFTASATISDATAAAFLTWAKGYYSATRGANTNQGAFNAWANEFFVQTQARMLQASQAAAALAATSAVAAPAITPSQ